MSLSLFLPQPFKPLQWQHDLYQRSWDWGIPNEALHLHWRAWHVLHYNLHNQQPMLLEAATKKFLVSAAATFFRVTTLTSWFQWPSCIQFPAFSILCKGDPLTTDEKPEWGLWCLKFWMYKNCWCLERYGNVLNVCLKNADVHQTWNHPIQSSFPTKSASQTNSGKSWCFPSKLCYHFISAKSEFKSKQLAL